MITRNRYKTVLILAALALAVFAGPALAAIPVPTGINPATGVDWAKGDVYRLAFHTSASRTAEETDIAVYNEWVQGLANASTVYDIGADDGVTWKVIGSTTAVDARDNTGTNPTVETGCPILLLDGTTIVANDNADLWDHSIQNIINLTEQGTVWAYWPWTGSYWDGTAAPGHPTSYGALGDGGQIGQGNASSTADWVWRTNTADPPTNLMPMYALSDPLVVGGGGPTYISPENGSTVPVGTVDLLWENMDPNFAGHPVYVDVWFGTDPDPKNGTKVLDAGVNTTTVQVSAPTEGTYYWQVGNYIYGSATGDPCEGGVWSFNTSADLPPSSVDAGDDMITWSGEPVSLDATIVDDGKSALTYAWSANPSDGVVFTPSAAVEDPTVTITKATDNPSTVTLTLAVNDVGNPTPVEGTMTIDVYDDACQLARIGLGLADKTDLDNNCITDLRDYAILAAKWLVDNALTAPIPKP